MIGSFPEVLIELQLAVSQTPPVHLWLGILYSQFIVPNILPIIYMVFPKYICVAITGVDLQFLVAF